MRLAGIGGTAFASGLSGFGVVEFAPKSAKIAPGEYPAGKQGPA